MPGFINVFFGVFIVLFLTTIIYTISRNVRLVKSNNKPIKEFRLNGKNYLLYSIKNYNRYYSNQITYELKDDLGNFYGAFNSLNDVLVFLDIDSFPENDIFSWKLEIKMTEKLFLENIKWIAHRGLSSKALENTLEAFELAGQLPFYGIECDIQITKDEKIVVYHDEDTKRLTNIKMLVKESTLQELRKLNIYIPELFEYLEICKKYHKKAVIEIKPLLNERQLKILIANLEKYDCLDNVVLISFFTENLKYLRNYSSKISLQLVSKKVDKDILTFCRENNCNIDLKLSKATRSNIKQIKENNLKINVWTVNNYQKAKRLINLGVDYITTNGFIVK